MYRKSLGIAYEDGADRTYSVTDTARRTAQVPMRMLDRGTAHSYSEHKVVQEGLARELCSMTRHEIEARTAMAISALISKLERRLSFRMSLP